MTDYKFSDLDDEELRERVLTALETIEQRMRGGGGNGAVTKYAPPSGSAGEAVLALRALFGDTGVDAEKAKPLEPSDSSRIDKDAEGWMSEDIDAGESEAKAAGIDEDSEVWM